MDLNQVIGIALAILAPLSPYLKRTGEVIASEIGKSVYDQSKSLYETISRKLYNENDVNAQTTLDNLSLDDHQTQASLKNAIIQLAESDLEFKEALETQVYELRVILLDCLQQKFSESEVRQIYFRLGIRWNQFTGNIGGQSDKVLPLIEYLESEGKLPNLIKVMWQVRPGLSC